MCFFWGEGGGEITVLTENVRLLQKDYGDMIFPRGLIILLMTKSEGKLQDMILKKNYKKERKKNRTLTK